MNELENVISYLYKPKTEFVIFGNINIDYRSESNRRQCLNSLLASHNVMSRVNFCTKIKNYTGNAVDNIFIDSFRELIYMKPVITPLFDRVNFRLSE
jgi:hypothetical protein